MRSEKLDLNKTGEIQRMKIGKLAGWKNGDSSTDVKRETQRI